MKESNFSEEIRLDLYSKKHFQRGTSTSITGDEFSVPSQYPLITVSITFSASDPQRKRTASSGLLTATVTRPSSRSVVSAGFLIRRSCSAGDHQHTQLPSVMLICSTDQHVNVPSWTCLGSPEQQREISQTLLRPVTEPALYLCVCSMPFLQSLPQDVIMKMSDLMEEVGIKFLKLKHGVVQPSLVLQTERDNRVRVHTEGMHANTRVYWRPLCVFDFTSLRVTDNRAGAVIASDINPSLFVWPHVFMCVIEMLLLSLFLFSLKCIFHFLLLCLSSYVP